MFATAPHRPTETISLVILASTNAASVASIAAAAQQQLQSLDRQGEVIVSTVGDCDPGSLKQPAKKSIHVRTLINKPGQSIGRRFNQAIRSTTGDLVFVLDARGEYDVTELNRLLLLLEDFDCVRGYRQHARQLRISPIVGSIEAFLLNRVLACETRDPTCGWLAFRRTAAAGFTAQTNGDFCFAELSSHIRVNELPQADTPVSGSLPGRSLLRSITDWGASVRRSYTELWFPGNEPIRTDTAWSSRWAIAGLIFAAIVLLFSNLSYPLVEPDETRYAEVSLEMLQRGDWVIPTIQGEPFLDKPPLLYWLTMISYSLFGVSEWSARLPIALAAFACVMSIYGIGRKLVGPRSAWIGAALLLMCAGFLLAGRFVITDCLLASCTTICGLAAYTAIREKSIHWGWWLLACLAAAAGVLTKGPLALVLCGPPLVAAWWLTGNRRAWNWKAAALLTVIVAALAAPWYVLIHFSQQEFASHFYLKQYVARYVNAFDHKEPWWFYLPVLFVGMLPTSLLLPSLGVFTFSGKQGVRQQRTPEAGFLLMWVCWIIGFFSLASCKLPTYILPAIPPLCLLLGKMVDGVMLRATGKWFLENISRSFPRHAAIASCTTLAIAAIVRLALVESAFPNGFDCLVLVTSITAFATLSFIFYPANRSRWAVAGVCTIVALGYLFNAVYPLAMTQRSYLISAAETLQQWEDENLQASPVAFFNNRGDGRQFYLADVETHQVTEENLPKLFQLVARRRQVMIITAPREAEKLAALLPADIDIEPCGGRGFVWKVTDRPLRLALRP